MRKIFSIEGMSNVGIKKLGSVLDDMGYAGRYIIDPTWLTLSIDSTSPVVRSAIKEAEIRGHNEKGHMIILRKTSYTTLWVPESEAETEKEARIRALKMATEEVNGWGISQLPRP